MLRMGFVVLQIVGPDGLFMNEGQIAEQLGPPPLIKKKPSVRDKPGVLGSLEDVDL